ncbi:MAG: DUF308 domain-containing protein [Clostridiales bacterium]|nr:DUF308 domain-containing protein [Clostridiales bacterium]
MEDKTKSNMLKIIVFALELILGVILLINPVGVTKVIIISAGILSLIYALVNIISYFRLDPVTASLCQCMFVGISLTAAAIIDILALIADIVWELKNKNKSEK